MEIDLGVTIKSKHIAFSYSGSADYIIFYVYSICN
jgi:hypothetical protein